MSASVARRYAKAIAAIAREESSLDETGSELQALADAARDPSIAAGLANPLLPAPKRRELAQSIGEKLGLRPAVRNLLSLLADHRRLDQLLGIADHYQKLVDETLGRVRAKIASAAEMSAEEERAVIGALEKLTAKTVLAERRVDPELLGGVVVEIAGKVYDGSLRTQLERLAAGIAGQHSFL